jgi:DNA-directed RNA polymerase subunit RPC12/RpoP
MIVHRTLRPGERVTLCGIGSGRLHRTEHDEEVTCRRCQLLIAKQPPTPSVSELASAWVKASRGATHEFVCPECGRRFESTRDTAVTCSSTCRSRRRRRLGTSGPRPDAVA